MSRWGRGSAGPRGPYKDYNWEIEQTQSPIARARKILGLTQHQAAAELKVSRSTLAKWEAGHAQPPAWGIEGRAIDALVARAAKVEETK